ncbi:MAG: hypothetical protein HN712_02935 [Gemmatimonadetes bacterium]|jgi:hypothetical protein|nr:hypothetical protein [Gemmatimonadota bacterium]MBT7859233.1 hypothetical protein [Gemmatimonadota bacterium]
MSDVAYDAWYFIPLDESPTVGRESRPQPPQMTVIAVDAGSSLAFQVQGVHSALEITVTATGLSAEGRQADVVDLFTGEQIDGTFSPAAVTWTRSQDGMNAVFQAPLPRVAPIIKLRVAAPPSLVVTKVEFNTP